MPPFLIHRIVIVSIYACPAERGVILSNIIFMSVIFQNSICNIKCWDMITYDCSPHNDIAGNQRGRVWGIAVKKFTVWEVRILEVAKGRRQNFGTYSRKPINNKNSLFAGKEYMMNGFMCQGEIGLNICGLWVRVTVIVHRAEDAEFSFFCFPLCAIFV